MTKKIAIFVFTLIFFLVQKQLTNASSFTTDYLRLDDLKANSILSGTLCASASSAGAGIENSVSIIFPSDFTINNSTSDWTTNTSNLPSGSTPWPGISANATGISGKTATFASSDLTTTNLYCFNFSTTLSKTSSASGNDKVGTITTRNLSSVIDSATIAVSIVANNQIAITAGVDPQQSDLPITIESTTPGTDFAQYTTIGYKITYGSNTAGSIPLTIQASWSQGTIDGDPAPSVDILNYVVGSASNGYGGAPAVVDTINRTITWTIPSFPGATTGQILNFSLQTTANYIGPKKVYFTISAHTQSGSTVTPDDSVTQDYLYNSGAVTPTPTVSLGGPGDQRSDNRSDGKSFPSGFRFTNLEIRSVYETSATIYAQTSTNTKMFLTYGTKPFSQDKTIQLNDFSLSKIFQLTNLTSGTKYYFKIYATDSYDKTISSDIFTFTAAVPSEIPTVDSKSLLIVSSNVILLSPPAQTQIFSIPKNSEFTIQFSLLRPLRLKLIQAIVRNKQVLGFSTITPPNASKNYVNFVETRPGIYTGKLASSDTGKYEIYARLADANGHIVEQKLVDMVVVERFKVLKQGANTPIENARILLNVYNESSRTYEIISPNILPILNPAYSAPNGEYNIILPYGKYRTEISAIGYGSKTVDFSISPNFGGYPTVLLKAHFDILSTIEYYIDTASDTIASIQSYITDRASSSRLFDLSTVGAIFLFAIICIFAVSAKTHVSIFYLPYFLVFKTLILFKNGRGNLIFGKIVDENQTQISKASVTIYSETKIVAKLTTNKLGEFYFNNPKNLNYKINIQKQGFKSSNFNFVNSKQTDLPFKIQIIQTQKPKYSGLNPILIYAESLLGLLTEILIILGLLMQIFFIPTFGFLRIAPFILITILNLVLVFLFLYKPREIKA